VSDGVDAKVDAEKRRLSHGLHPTLLQLRIVGSGQSVSHESSLSKLFDVGHVTGSGFRVDGDHVAALTLLDEVENDLIADPEKNKLKCFSFQY
jgi:hypothetical protein